MQSAIASTVNCDVRSKFDQLYCDARGRLADLSSGGPINLWGNSMKYPMTRLALLMAAVTALTGCFLRPSKHNLPPAQQLMHPGPGVGGPGPGVMLPGSGFPGAVAPPMAQRSSQLYFVGPGGMTVHWDATMPGAFDSEPLVAPGRQNFPQGAIYRLKLTNIAGREGVELYPTIEIAPENPRTEAFLAHNPIPVQLTEEDFDQVATSNFVTKVIYVPDAEFQELAVAGVQTLVSTRLDPGQNPIVEADRRGSILAIVRLGNIDLQIPGADGAAIDAQVRQAGYGTQIPGQAPFGSPVSYYGGGGAMPPGYQQMAGGPMAMPPTGPVSGYNVPQYGMPSSATPIGLPGPPHIPLGVGAGLMSHTIKNHTRQRIPGPVNHFKIGVKQSPGFSYPKPVSRAFIHEKNNAMGLRFSNPFKNLLQMAP